LKNVCGSEAKQEYNSILDSYVALSIKGPQQQLISLQVWLYASFSNRYGIAQWWRTCGPRKISCGPRSIQARPAVLNFLWPAS